MAESLVHDPAAFRQWFPGVRRTSRWCRTHIRQSWDQVLTPALRRGAWAAHAEQIRADYARLMAAEEALAGLVNYLDTEYRADPAYLPSRALCVALTARWETSARALTALPPLPEDDAPPERGAAVDAALAAVDAALAAPSREAR